MPSDFIPNKILKLPAITPKVDMEVWVISIPEDRSRIDMVDPRKMLILYTNYFGALLQWEDICGVHHKFCEFKFYSFRLVQEEGQDDDKKS